MGKVLESSTLSPHRHIIVLEFCVFDQGTAWRYRCRSLLEIPPTLLSYSYVRKDELKWNHYSLICVPQSSTSRSSITCVLKISFFGQRDGSLSRRSRCVVAGLTHVVA